jgi:hypothetical protein
MAIINESQELFIKLIRQKPEIARAFTGNWSVVAGNWSPASGLAAPEEEPGESI